MAQMRSYVSDKVFVLGFSGDESRYLPQSWVNQIGDTVTVFGKRHYFEALCLPPEIKVSCFSEFEPNFASTINEIKEAKGSVLLLASGDPGFFGPVQRLRKELGEIELNVEPAASSVATAAARLGISYQDATVASLVRNDTSFAMGTIESFGDSNETTIFILTPSNDAIQQAITALCAHSIGSFQIDIFFDLGFKSECHRTFIATTGSALSIELPQAKYSIMVCRKSSEIKKTTRHTIAHSPTKAITKPPGAPSSNARTESFVSRGAMYTKPEIRSIVVAKLAPWSLPHNATVWDLGAGSGSVGLEMLLIRPDLKLIAVDRDPNAIELIEKNAKSMNLSVELILGNCESVIDELGSPSAIFVGGGGPTVLEKVVSRFDSSLRIAATSTTLENAQSAYNFLGNQILVQIHALRPLGSSGRRLDGENPVFISWKESP